MSALIERLSDADLRRTTPDGWEVSAVFAHIAFWDRCTLARWERYGDEAAFRDVDVDIANAAALPQWRALAPREALRDALAAAEATDAKIASMPDSAIALMLGHDRRWMTDRSRHRNAHLDEVEQAIAR
jgi:hypothetical protein